MKAAWGVMAAVALVIVAALTAGAAAPLEESPYPPRRNSIVRVVEEVSPAVVNISTEATDQRPNPFYQVDPMFRDFFAPFGRSERRQSLGSGVIIDPRGYIVTNQHVILPASEIHVTDSSGAEYPGRLIGASSRFDLAVIKVDAPHPLPTAQLGTSADLMIGETVIAIGNPFGLKSTVSTGVVSALNRDIQPSEEVVYRDFIQIDAPINPGNSGGPLLNIEGRLIGITSAIYRGAEGIGFAIPVDRVRRILDHLMTTGTVPEPWIGAHVQDVGPRVARALHVESGTGVLVSMVVAGSPAGQAGLKPGDLILAVESVPVTDCEQYYGRIGDFTPGDRLRMSVTRDGQPLDVSVHAAEVPRSLVRQVARQWLGLEIDGLDRPAARQYRVYTDKGVLVTRVDPDSPGGRIGIRPGDVLAGLGGRRIDGLEDFEQAVIQSAAQGPALVNLIRGRYLYHLTIE